ncbi:ZP domain-containing protein [Trichostrongylus colubriformis]|uniref:ZP domain-containing protein n=1 Tax=Trichostrongylus colubriformis TaxID=6319 RepID=A0AAN8FI76_TRICO
MRRQRTMHPRGVSFSFTLVVSFHPFFVTGMDRAFHVRCFFLESVKSLGTEYDVGQLQTETVDQDFQLPDCIYQLHDGLTGPPVQFAQVGQRVTHRWSCEDGSKHIYGLLIHSCVADDGQDNKFELVDDRGCSTDTYLLPQIRYDPKSLSAFTDAHVFKYADKVQLYFTCTVQLCYKHDGGCDGVTPPKCDGVDAAHFEHMDGPPKEHASSEGPPFRIPDFPQEIPFEHLHGNGHPGPEHGPSGKEDLFQGLLNGPGAPEKHFFRPIDIPKEFNRCSFD